LSSELEKIKKRIERIALIHPGANVVLEHCRIG
jgi:hypothetical protein